MFRTCTIFAVIAVLTSIAHSQDDGYLLRYKFKEGDSIRWNVVHRIHNETTMKETTIVTDTYSESEKVWKIKKVNSDGSATIENSVAWMNLWQSVTGQNRVSYDSRTDKTPSPCYENMPKMTNTPLAEITLNDRGEIVKREDFFPQTELQLLNPAQLLVPFPERRVLPGDVWSVEKIVYVPKPGSTVFKVKTVQKYLLESVEDDVATISYYTQILTPIHDPKTLAQLVQCRAKGTMTFNIKSGKAEKHVLSLNQNVPHFSGDASIVKHKNRSTETLLQEIPAEVIKQSM